MRSRKAPVAFRAAGQRSLPSLFSSCSKTPAKVAEENPDEGNNVPLSDSSERKLLRTSAKSTTVKERLRPFSSVFGSRDLSESMDEQVGAKKGGEAEKNHVAALVALELFNHTDLGKGHSVGPSTAGEVESSNEDVVQESRKRRNPFEGNVTFAGFTQSTYVFGYKSDPPPLPSPHLVFVFELGGGYKPIVRKNFTVLGGDPTPKPNQKRRRDESLIVGKEKPGPAYNHYASGRGWWDCDREGIDNEEVGLNEVWEGVGSTTLGGIEWH
ncbi:hypothetical protein DVH24_000700 [Malus domestica]|uniref:Uncharacterized protein n=1 Tax=Malus domestica TaxID=3750 RepID=A0A498JYZ3_MALDO|nr:hypothetical protein DVH24_000700 [Malus domestica]